MPPARKTATGRARQRAEASRAVDGRLFWAHSGHMRPPIGTGRLRAYPLEPKYFKGFARHARLPKPAPTFSSRNMGFLSRDLIRSQQDLEDAAIDGDAAPSTT